MGITDFAQIKGFHGWGILDEARMSMGMRMDS
jgi:hypothetical protein